MTHASCLLQLLYMHQDLLITLPGAYIWPALHLALLLPSSDLPSLLPPLFTRALCRAPLVRQRGFTNSALLLPLLLLAPLSAFSAATPCAGHHH